MNYWKIKALVLEVRQVEAAAQAAVAQARTTLGVALQEAGLDPAGSYHLDDAAETITPHEGVPSGG